MSNFDERASVLHGGETRGAEATAILRNPAAAPATWLAVAGEHADLSADDDGQSIHLVHPTTPAPGRPIDLKREIETIELEQIHVALDLADCLISAAARLLSPKRTTLIEQTPKYGVQQQHAASSAAPRTPSLK